jgi:hypothetical protein
MVVVRSLSSVSSTEEGKAARNVGIRAWMRSTVSMTLAPGWRWMVSTTAARSLAQAASLVFSAASMVSATSLRRMGAPFFQAMTRLRYSLADLSWSLASMVADCEGPSKLPLAWLTLLLPIAVRRSSIVRPRAASATGLAWMRTAGRCPPVTATRPTPCSCESFWATRVSTMSCTCVSGRVREVTPMVTTGASAGLTLL